MDLLELKCTSISTVLYKFLRKVLLTLCCNTPSSDGRFEVSSKVYKHL